MLHSQYKQSSVSHNNGWRKCRNQVLNRQQSSASHIKLCATQSGQGKLCVAQQRLGKKPEPCFEQAGKLCATQSVQVKLCVTKGPGKKPEPGFEQAEKLCAAQSGQEEALCHTIGTRGDLCCIVSTSKALCRTTTAGEKAGNWF